MLGIQHYNHIPCDLWVGNPQHFFCDRMLVLRTDTSVTHGAPPQNFSCVETLFLTSSSLEGFEKNLHEALSREAQPAQHLAFYIENENTPCFSSLSEHLFSCARKKLLEKHSIRRITWVSRTLPSHEIHKKLLFSILSEKKAS